MKRTGPTREKTKKLIAMLEKASRKGKKALWLDIAERLGKPSRQKHSVNLWKVDKLARLFKGKHLLVPGKVLGKGVLQEKASVIAFGFSETARERIEKAGGKAMELEEAIGKVKENEVVIVK